MKSSNLMRVLTALLFGLCLFACNQSRETKGIFVLNEMYINHSHIVERQTTRLEKLIMKGRYEDFFVKNTALYDSTFNKLDVMLDSCIQKLEQYKSMMDDENVSEMIIQMHNNMYDFATKEVPLYYGGDERFRKEAIENYLDTLDSLLPFDKTSLEKEYDFAGLFKEEKYSLLLKAEATLQQLRYCIYVAVYELGESIRKYAYQTEKRDIINAYVKTHQVSKDSIACAIYPYRRVYSNEFNNSATYRLRVGDEYIPMSEKQGVFYYTFKPKTLGKGSIIFDIFSKKKCF